jgi:amino acid transporter
MQTKESVGQLVKEPDGPLTAAQAVPTAIMFLVAMLGGFIHFYRKWKEGDVRAFNFTELLGELVVSGLCGVLAFWLFRGLGVNEWLTAAGVGIVGHMGSRALFLAEKTVGNLADRWSQK